MSQEIAESALMKFLANKNQKYCSRLIDVRKSFADWLSMIPATFPHYTNHTIRHSDEIIFQLSKLLFINSDYKKPIVQLSGVECYILCACAYIHDAGMVTSEREKAEILLSNSWKEFVSEGTNAAKRWKDIDEFRKSNKPEDPSLRNFLADLQVRFLIAEYVRKNHHIRTADILSGHDFGIMEFSFGDPALKDTIQTVCVSHGLNHFELLDDTHFPERRDIRNEQVNVRFLSFLLRIGDLLDISYDRACPLLLNAASPIPSDSLAHWTKYQRIRHRLTSPDRIELHAICENQDEHRFLKDWCQWLVDEVKEAGIGMNRSKRHCEWQPPQLSMDGDGSTIKIEPSPTANYIPSTWRFVLDEIVVFQRLIKDVYNHPFAFVRELIQNSLDATRCQVLLDVNEKGGKTVDLIDLPDDTLNRYPIIVTLSLKKVPNELSGTIEDYHVLSVEDLGIGMDRTIIENYLLQIGRSFYFSEEFRRKFCFVPTSRFGVGFLSVFAVSDNVTLETFKPTSPTHEGSLKLTLTGPRKYLLTEKGNRRISGTKVEVLLRKNIDCEQLQQSIRNWCAMVEFPVKLSLLGNESIVSCEKPKDFEKRIVLQDQKKIIQIRAHPIQGFGLRGEIYLLSVLDGKNERWDMQRWVRDDYPKIHPAFDRVDVPDNIVCVNGIVVNSNRASFEPVSYRIDLRRKTELPMSRDISHMRYRDLEDAIPEIKEHIEKLITSHLNGSKISKNERTGWIYKNKVIDTLRRHVTSEFISSIPGTLKTFKKGELEFVSEKKANEEEIITMCINSRNGFNIGLLNCEKIKDDSFDRLIVEKDFVNSEQTVLNLLLKERIVSKVIRAGNDKFYINLVKKEERIIKHPLERYEGSLFDFKVPDLIGLNVDYPFRMMLLNISNPLIKWLLVLRKACINNENGITDAQCSKTWDLLIEYLEIPTVENSKTVNNYLSGWRDMRKLPKELRPPEIEVKPSYVICIGYRYSNFTERALKLASQKAMKRLAKKQ